MSKKQLRSRLDNLFATLEPEEVFETPIDPAAEAGPGWTWECDADGNFLVCSPEVSQVIGYSPAEIAGQSLLSFGLAEESKPAIQRAIQKGQFPTEIEIKYLGGDGRCIPVRMSIFTYSEENGELGGYHGFVQSIPEKPFKLFRPFIDFSIEDVPPEPEPETVREKIPPAMTIPSGEEVSDSSLLAEIDQIVHQPASKTNPAEVVIPFKISEDAQGVIKLVDEDADRHWTQEERSLIQEVSQQLNLALENAQLYAAVQQELAVRTKAEREVSRRERYQKSIAQAVATLSELGTMALPEVLQHLGEASGTDGITCFVVHPDEDSPYWENINEWYKEGIERREYWSQLPIHDNKLLADELANHGYVSGITQELPAAIQALLAPLGVTSFLAISVPGKNSVPGFIAFAEMGSERFWGVEEIEALQLAAAALSNTYVREDLLGQLESSLDETESLYNASRKLAVAGDMQSMASAILESLPIPEVNRAELVLFEISPGITTHLRVAANWYNSSGKPPKLVGASYDVGVFESFFTRSQPLFVDQLLPETDQAAALSEFAHEGGIASLAVLPLWAGKRQIGALVLLAEKLHSFTDREIRSYPPLANQMAIAIENLRLFEQTQESLAETENLYQASAELNTAQDYGAVLGVMRKFTVIGQGAHVTDLTLFNVPWEAENPPQWLEVQARWTTLPVEDFVNRYPIDTFPAFKLLRPDSARFVEDVSNRSSWDENTRLLFEKTYQAKSTIFIPLVVGGQWIGFFNAMYPVVTHLEENEIRKAMGLAAQAAVAVQNLRNIAATQKRADESSLLFTTSQQMTAAHSEEELLQQAVQACKRGVALGSVSIHMFGSEAGKAYLEQAAHLTDSGVTAFDDKNRFPARIFPFTDQLMAGETIVSNNVTLDSRVNEAARRFLVHMNVASAMAVPLRVRGQNIGVVLCTRQHLETFNDSEITFIETVCAQLSISLDNYRLLQEAQQSAREAHERSEELTLINRVVSAVAGSLDLRAGLQTVISELGRAFDLASGGIALLNEDRTSMTLVADYAKDGRSAAGMVLPVEGNPSAQKVLATRQPLILTDAQRHPLTESFHDRLVLREINTLVILPLVAGKEVIGTVALEISEPERVFTNDELRLAETIIFQAAAAIQNARLFDQTQTALAETELLYRISRSVATATSPRELLDLVFENALPKTADQITFLLSYEDQFGRPSEIEKVGYRQVGGSYEEDGTRFPFQSMPLINQIGTEPFMITDLFKSEIDPSSQQIMGKMNALTACLISFRTAGRLTGMMVVSSKQHTEFSKREIRLLQITGDGISVALEKQRLLLEAQRRALELQTAAEIARDTSGTLALDILLKRIVNMLCERFGFYHAAIFLLDETGSYAVVRESTGEAGVELKQRGHRLAVGSRSVIGTTTATAQPVVVNDVLQSEVHRFNPLLPETRAELGIPLKLGERVIGALDVQSTLVNSFHSDDVIVLQILADQIAVAIDNARAYELSQKAVEEMREVDRVKSQFLANMSHELRTPLNSIIGFSRVILKGIDGPITDIQQQDLTAIYNSGQHLLRLINDILDLSKIEAGKMELSFDDLNIPDLVNSVMSTAAGLVKDKQIKLIRKIPADLPTVRADPMRIRQVLINLLSNAAKFTDEGSIIVEAAVESSSEGIQEMVIRVTDTGPGIAAEDQKKLFQPFSQVDDSPTRKTGGSGLGLSICRSLIEMHNGRIGLEKSAIGAGSTFYFALPLHPPTLEPESELGDGQLILAIDDDAQVISLYERYLRPHGYKVIALTDPTQAVTQARQLKPVAITLDVMMPNRDGWQVIKDLKADEETKEIPVIFCTILEQVEKGFSLGAADYLCKPILQEDLLHALNQINRDGSVQEILVVDDDPDDLRLIQKILDNQPQYHLSLAKGGNQGWATITQNPPQAIIMDLFMPDLNGFALLEKLRANPTLRDIPVIVLTGADLTPEQHQQLTSFGQDLLAKGLLKENELLYSLEKVLSRTRYPKASQ
ncbi:MAG TPA: GAF domain-containing protein [Anaerolineaceae bacterium]|nr:GAF domain-containing protein [Anaerolineaceae bacterium]